MDNCRLQNSWRPGDCVNDLPRCPLSDTCAAPSVSRSPDNWSLAASTPVDLRVKPQKTLHLLSGRRAGIVRGFRGDELYRGKFPERVLIGFHPSYAREQGLRTFQDHYIPTLLHRIDEIARGRERELVVVGPDIGDGIAAGEALVHIDHRDAGGVELVDSWQHGRRVEGRKHDRIRLVADHLVDQAELIRWRLASRDEVNDQGIERLGSDLAANAHPAQDRIGRVAGEGGDSLGASRCRGGRIESETTAANHAPRYCIKSTPVDHKPSRIFGDVGTSCQNEWQPAFWASTQDHMPISGPR